MPLKFLILLQNNATIHICWEIKNVLQEDVHSSCTVGLMHVIGFAGGSVGVGYCRHTFSKA